MDLRTKTGRGGVETGRVVGVNVRRMGRGENKFEFVGADLVGDGCVSITQ